ncbi:MAG: hypothetical protein P4N59_22075 [Negativicutes bacterium]|nr:hypothetical protein [Negativicutes bacterium]
METALVRPHIEDTLIADMAKGFVEAQAKLKCPPDVTNDMVALLEKISRQLDNLQQVPVAPPSGQTVLGQGGSGMVQNAGSGQQTPPADQEGNAAASHLQALFAQSLQAGRTGQQNPSSGGASSRGQAKATPAQTAAQALATAQYELSQELEASLEKLKKVIAESESLAGRISGMIGGESNTK